MTELYVLRHGETEWNVAGRMQGQLDSPLTRRGLMQARAMRQRLAAIRTDWTGWDFLTSPLGRAQQTADIALGGLGPPIATDARLAEIGMGSWQGLDQKQIAARWPGTAAKSDPLDWYGAMPDGEPLAQVRARVEAFLADLPRPAVVVTHGFVSRYLRGLALGLPERSFGQLSDAHGVVWHIRDGEVEDLAALA